MKEVKECPMLRVFIKYKCSIRFHSISLGVDGVIGKVAYINKPFFGTFKAMQVKRLALPRNVLDAIVHTSDTTWHHNPVVTVELIALHNFNWPTNCSNGLGLFDLRFVEAIISDPTNRSLVQAIKNNIPDRDSCKYTKNKAT